MFDTSILEAALELVKENAEPYYNALILLTDERRFQRVCTEINGYEKIKERINASFKNKTNLNASLFTILINKFDNDYEKIFNYLNGKVILIGDTVSYFATIDEAIKFTQENPGYWKIYEEVNPKYKANEQYFWNIKNAIKYIKIQDSFIFETL